VGKKLRLLALVLIQQRQTLEEVSMPVTKKAKPVAKTNSKLKKDMAKKKPVKKTTKKK
jgi:hypothetical protein